MYDGTAYRLLSITNGASLVPLGSVILSLSTAIPAGYLKLNGALISRTTYAGLWSVAQASGALVTDAQWTTTANRMWGSWSSGDGSTTFRLPEFRGEFPRFFDDSRGVDSARTLGVQQRGTTIMYDDIVGDTTLYGQLGGTGPITSLLNADPADGGSTPTTAWINSTANGGTINAGLGGLAGHSRPRNITLIPLIRAL
jgi:phage-related tail fiber protein